MKDLLAALEKVPLTLRQGPWSPIAIIYLISFFAYLIYSYPLAIKSIESIDEPEPSQYLTTFRLISSCTYLFIFNYLFINKFLIQVGV